MFSTFRTTTIGAAALALAVSLAPGVARADLITFDFTGLCTDCSAAAGKPVTANAELTVQNNYQLGAQFNMSNFSSFHYDGTNLLPAFTITPSDVTIFSGSIGPNLPGEFEVLIASSASNGSLGLGTAVNGTWQAGFVSDHGTLGTWSAVPEPASLTLLAMGLAGLGMVVRRRRA